MLLLKRGTGSIEIDNWVMSCRAFQRGVEEFAFNRILALARAEGASEIVASYVPTAKNGMASGHYGALGFEEVGRDGDAVRFRYRIGREGADRSTHIQLESAT